MISLGSNIYKETVAFSKSLHLIQYACSGHCVSPFSFICHKSGCSIDLFVISGATCDAICSSIPLTPPTIKNGMLIDPAWHFFLHYKIHLSSFTAKLNRNNQFRDSITRKTLISRCLYMTLLYGYYFYKGGMETWVGAWQFSHFSFLPVNGLSRCGAKGIRNHSDDKFVFLTGQAHKISPKDPVQSGGQNHTETRGKLQNCRNCAGCFFYFGPICEIFSYGCAQHRVDTEFPCSLHSNH